MKEQLVFYRMTNEGLPFLMLKHFAVAICTYVVAIQYCLLIMK